MLVILTEAHRQGSLADRPSFHLWVMQAPVGGSTPETLVDLDFAVGVTPPNATIHITGVCCCDRSCMQGWARAVLLQSHASVCARVRVHAQGLHQMLGFARMTLE